MGTNYYAIPKADEETKKRIIEAINSDKWGEAKSLIPERVHIGKSAGGWQFLFNHNDWQYFDKTQKSVAEFLAKCEIIDEYGDPHTANEFWVMVDRKAGHKPELQYGIVEDGLVFSNYTDFS